MVQALFVTPAIDGTIRDALLDLISQAQYAIDVAIYSFTDDVLAEALIEAHKRGVQVRVMMEATNVNSQGSEACRLVRAGIPVRNDLASGLFHHKFLVIDGIWVVTGSYNWSAAANDKNYENVVILRCSEIAAFFVKHFDTMLWPLGISPNCLSMIPSDLVQCQGRRNGSMLLDISQHGRSDHLSLSSTKVTKILRVRPRTVQQ